MIRENLLPHQPAQLFIIFVRPDGPRFPFPQSRLNRNVTGDQEENKAQQQPQPDYGCNQSQTIVNVVAHAVILAAE